MDSSLALYPGPSFGHMILPDKVLSDGPKRVPFSNICDPPVVGLFVPPRTWIVCTSYDVNSVVVPTRTPPVTPSIKVFACPAGAMAWIDVDESHALISQAVKPSRARKLGANPGREFPMTNQALKDPAAWLLDWVVLSCTTSYERTKEALLIRKP
eukprot:3296608-Rhodomonas_salina.3